MAMAEPSAADRLVLPVQGIDTDTAAVHAGAVNPRHGVFAGAAMAVLAGAVLAIAPVTWLEAMLAVDGQDATTFLIRRYAASATAALAVVAAGTAGRMDPRRAVLLGLSTWFAVQGVTAWWGVASGAVGGFAWVAVVADPLIAAWFLFLSRRTNGSV